MILQSSTRRSTSEYQHKTNHTQTVIDKKRDQILKELSECFADHGAAFNRLAQAHLNDNPILVDEDGEIREVFLLATKAIREERKGGISIEELDEYLGNKIWRELWLALVANQGKFESRQKAELATA